MTVDRMGKWQIIVEGANTYSPDPARKAERRRMERHVYRDKGTLIATDYLVNSGGVIYAAHERIIPTPDHLLIPKTLLGHPRKIETWLEKIGKILQPWPNNDDPQPLLNWKPSSGGTWKN